MTTVSNQPNAYITGDVLQQIKEAKKNNDQQALLAALTTALTTLKAVLSKGAAEGNGEIEGDTISPNTPQGTSGLTTQQAFTQLKSILNEMKAEITELHQILQAQKNGSQAPSSQTQTSGSQSSNCQNQIQVSNSANVFQLMQDLIDLYNQLDAIYTTMTQSQMNVQSAESQAAANAQQNAATMQSQGLYAEAGGAFAGAGISLINAGVSMWQSGPAARDMETSQTKLNQLTGLDTQARTEALGQARRGVGNPAALGPGEPIQQRIAQLRNGAYDNTPGIIVDHNQNPDALAVMRTGHDPVGIPDAAGHPPGFVAPDPELQGFRARLSDKISDQTTEVNTKSNRLSQIQNNLSTYSGLASNLATGIAKSIQAGRTAEAGQWQAAQALAQGVTGMNQSMTGELMRLFAKTADEISSTVAALGQAAKTTGT